MKKILKKLRAIDTKWLNFVTGRDFNIVAQDDFNPDGVLLFGYDSYKRGFRNGCDAMVIAALIGLAWGMIEDRSRKKGGK